MSQNDFVRFMVKVEISRTPGACWTWVGCRPDGTYGHFTVGKKHIKAHRWIFEHLNGPIPVGLVCRHACDNPSCVNPAHLLTGTMADNSRDMVERGRCRGLKGELNPVAKLNADAVLEIRRRAGLGERLYILAGEYGVKRHHVGKIVQRRAWSHI